MTKSGKRRKNRKNRNPVMDYLAYLGLRLVTAMLFCFRVESCLKFASFLGTLMWDHYHRGRKRALDNLRASFPDKDEEWLIKTGRRSFQHIVMLIVDILFTPRLVKRNNWQKYSRYVNCERIKWMMHERKGMLMLTAHYGNFEIMGYLLGLFGFNIYSIARPLDNRFINNHLYGLRQKAGQKIINKKGVSSQVDKIVQDGGTLCFIADQDAGKKGVFVDFFGRKASTYKSIGIIAMSYNLPIGVACSRRRDNEFYFDIICNRIITPDEWKDKEKPLEWITAEYTKAIEDFIREDPSQYWWLHRRWKHKPRGNNKSQKLKIQNKLK